MLSLSFGSRLRDSLRQFHCLLRYRFTASSQAQLGNSRYCAFLAVPHGLDFGHFNKGSSYSRYWMCNTPYPSQGLIDRCLQASYTLYLAGLPFYFNSPVPLSSAPRAVATTTRLTAFHKSNSSASRRPTSPSRASTSLATMTLRAACISAGQGWISTQLARPKGSTVPCPS